MFSATKLANTAIFTDTTSTGFAASSIGTSGTTQTGSSSSVQDYYLFRRDGTDVTPDHNPIYITDSDNLQSFSIEAAATLLGNWLKYTAAQSADGYKITYSITTDGSGGNARGTSMVDTKLNGSGAYTTKLINTDDYRAQEFPNGSPATVTTYTLRITKS